MTDDVREAHEDVEHIRLDIPIPDILLEEQEIEDIATMLMPQVEEAILNRLMELFDE